MIFERKYKYVILAEDNYSFEKCNKCKYSHRLNNKLYCENKGFDKTIDKNGKCILWMRKK